MMERRFDMSDFEQSLKDHADQFKLVPSKRVWTGIYNNLHPGSRWPSVTVAIILMITLVTIGNMNNSPKPKVTTFLQSIPVTVGQPPAAEDHLLALRSAETGRNSDHIFLPGGNYTDHGAPGSFHQVAAAAALEDPFVDQPGLPGDAIALDPLPPSDNRGISPEKNFLSRDPGHTVQDGVEAGSSSGDGTRTILRQSGVPSPVISSGEEGNITLSPEPRVESSDELITISGMKVPENSSDWIHMVKNDFILPAPRELTGFAGARPSPFDASLQAKDAEAIHKTPARVPAKKPENVRRKRNPNIEWMVFVTPEVSTVVFRGKQLSGTVQGVNPIVVMPNRGSDEMVRNARLGFETGAQMLIRITKKWNFIAGGSLSYSGYNIVSNQVHPTSTHLFLKDENTGLVYSKSYPTHYGNGLGSQSQVSLNNYSMEFSVPLGLQYTLWGNDKIQIQLASTVQPSAILKENSFIISSDGRYYLQDPSLQRKVNLSGNFGSFVTFRTNKVKWHIGPQVRYQLLSTYKNNYTIKEHLMDYGIKIGISR